MRTKTFSADSIDQMLSRVDGALNEGFKPTFGFLFCSVSLDVAKVAEALSPFNFPFFGCSSCGEILQDDQPSRISKNSAVIALLELPPECFKLSLFEGQGLGSFEVGDEIGRWVQSAFAKPAVVMAVSGIKRDGEQVVRGLLSNFPEEIPLFGGLAGDDYRFKETFVFTNGSLSSDGAVVCVFDHDRVDLDGIATSGWVGVGAPMTVTSSEDNIVFSLQGRPALDVYTTYLDLNEADLPGIAVEYPLQLLSSSDDTHALRTVVGIDTQRRALIFAGSVPQGAQVRFSISPGFETVENSRKDFEQFHPRFEDADIMLYFSCMARLMAMGPVIEEELRAAQQLWKIPGLGFFCYGEFGKNTAGHCDFYNETCSLLFLRLK